ncbi:MAG: helix-turn-helix domain-containing protein, partial [Pseudomonadota bacterium]|nr:helix-turn-helix domain-containing protein [Pseudomonadota bacterium]
MGQRIRELRKRRGLSLEVVAASTGLSIGFLSQIERGLSSPTLRALTALADVSGVGIADLLQESAPLGDDAPTIARGGGRTGVTMWKSGIRKAVLAGGAAAAGARFAFTVLDFAAGASSGADFYSHGGEEA